jgi:biotin carboxyl carrier protein
MSKTTIMSRKAQIQLIMVFFSGITIFFSSCRNTPNESEESVVVKTPVTLTSVTFKPVVSTVEIPAVSQFMKKNIVRSSTAGTIENIQVRQGDMVNAGQLLFTVRTKEGAALEKIDGKDSSLYFSGLIRVYSGEAGYISAISYQRGDFVQEGDAVAIISDQGSLVFIMEIPFEYAGLSEKNKECAVTLPDGTRINGTIAGRLPDMNVESQTVSFIIRPHTSSRLPANLIAKVSVVRSSNENAQVLPKAAVLGNETQTDFWVMKLIDDSLAVRIDVKKGFESTSETEITEPLFDKSDRIILDGNYGLPDTAAITLSREN